MCIRDRPTSVQRPWWWVPVIAARAMADVYKRQGFDYRQDEGVSATGAPRFQTTLVVRFQQSEVGDLVTMLGLPSWPMSHP